MKTLPLILSLIFGSLLLCTFLGGLFALVGRCDAEINDMNKPTKDDDEN